MGFRPIPKRYDNRAPDPWTAYPPVEAGANPGTKASGACVRCGSRRVYLYRIILRVVDPGPFPRPPRTIRPKVVGCLDCWHERRTA